MNTRKLLSTLMLITALAMLFTCSIAFAVEEAADETINVTEVTATDSSGDTEDKSETLLDEVVVATNGSDGEAKEVEDEPAKNEEAIVSGEVVEDEKKEVSGDEVAKPEAEVSGEEVVASGEATVSGEEAVASGEATVSGEEAVASGEATVSGEEAVASGEATVSGEEAVVSGEAVASGDEAIVSGDSEKESGEEVIEKPTDVVEGSWYEKYVDEALTNGFISNKKEDKFMPQEAATVEEALKGALEVETKINSGDDKIQVFISSGDENPIEDEEDSEYVKVSLSGDGSANLDEFLDRAVTREEVAKVVYGVAQVNGKGFKGTWAYLLEFEDKDEISDDAFEAIAWCNMCGIIVGRDDNKVHAKDVATRAELATILVRLNEAL